MKKHFTVAQLLLASILGVYTSAHAQLGIGTTSPNNSAVLEMSSTKQGFLPPRMTTQQRDVINKGDFAEGLMIYNTDEKCIQVWDGEVWGCTGGVSTGGEGGVTNMMACAGLKNVKSLDNKHGEANFFLGGDNKLYSAEGLIPLVNQVLHGKLKQTEMILSVPSVSLSKITWKKTANVFSLNTNVVFLLSDSGKLYSIEHPDDYFTNSAKTLHVLRSTPHSSKTKTLTNELTPFEITTKDANNKTIIWEDIFVAGMAAYAYGNGNWYAWGYVPDKKMLGEATQGNIIKSSPTLMTMINTFSGSQDHISFAQHIGSVSWIDQNQEVNFYQYSPVINPYKISMPSGAKKPVKVVTTRNHSSGIKTEIYVLDAGGTVYEYSTEIHSDKVFKKVSVAGKTTYTDIHIGGTRYGRPYGIQLLDNKGNLYHYRGVGSNDFHNLTQNGSLPKLDKIFGFYGAYDNGSDRAMDELLVRSKDNGHLLALSFREPVGFLTKRGARDLILDDDMMFKITQFTQQGFDFGWYTLWHCADASLLSE